MDHSFAFNTSPSIQIGNGVSNSLGEKVHLYGDRAIIITGSFLKRENYIDQIKQSLDAFGIRSEFLIVSPGEPRLESVETLAELARDHRPHVVVGIGGGSVLDTAKAIGGLVHSPYPLLDYLEGVGKGVSIKHEVLPFIAVPTTAGTGSEVTKNAVITSYEQGFKKSFRSEALMAKHVLIDPELQTRLPDSITAISGLDALTQLIEAFITKHPNPITDALALKGIRYAARSLVRVYENPQDTKARSEMATAALFSGMALANAGLGMCHGIAAGVGAYQPIPHGLLCAVLLPLSFKVNQRVRPTRLAHVSMQLTHKSFPFKSSAIHAGYSYVLDLLNHLQIWQLWKSHGLHKSLISKMAAASFGNSMQGNPIKLSESQVVQWLEDLAKGTLYEG